MTQPHLKSLPLQADEPALSVLPKDLSKHALLLDVDGTLIDLAPTPREVFVPADLRDTLENLHDRTGGAVAFVSGRPIDDLDLLFAPLQLPAIGGHGAECRQVQAGPIDAAKIRPMDAALKRRFAAIAKAGPGILVEDKHFSIALHYRLAPALGGTIYTEAAAICAAYPRELELLSGKSVVEIKLVGYNKATAVRDLLTYVPFAGRRPIFIGDDTTDEVVFPIIPDYGGIGIAVGRRVSGTNGFFHSPADVRAWLRNLAAG